VEKIKNIKSLYVVLLIINVVWLFIFLRMTQQADDFYIVSPYGYHSILSSRPIDALISEFLKAFPFLFPWFNRTLLLVLHFVNCVMFHKVAVNILKQKEYTAAFALLYSISPWVFHAIAQTDGINNVIGFTFGLIGTCLYFKANNETKANIYYLVFSALSLGAKESNVANLVIIPATFLIKVIHGEVELEIAVKRIFRSYLLGVILFAVYFVVFFVVRVHTYGWDKDSSLNLIGRVGFPFAAFTGVNTFDIRNGLWVNAMVGLFLSVPLVILAFVNFVKLVKAKNKMAFTALLLFVCGEMFLLPTQVFAHMSDMHVYPHVFFVLLIILYYLPKNQGKALTNWFLVLYFVAFLFSDSEKVYRQNISSGYVREFQAEASRVIGYKPEKLYVIFPFISFEDRGFQYGGYAHDWFTAQEGGLSMYPIYGYDAISIRTAYYNAIGEIDGLIESAPDGYKILVVYPDKSMEVRVRNGR